MEIMKEMTKIVDDQNKNDHNYEKMFGNFDNSAYKSGFSCCQVESFITSLK